MPDVSTTEDEVEAARAEGIPDEKIATPSIESRGTTGSWESPHVAPVRPVPVSETGGEPTPVQQMGSNKLPAQPPPVDPDSIPDWASVTKSPTYQNASDDDRLTILDNYTAQARQAGHALADKNKEDPSVYDKHFDDFYAREKGALQTPMSIIDNTLKVGAQAAAKTTGEIISGTAQEIKGAITPESLELNLSRIGKMSVDEAKDERDHLVEAEKVSSDDVAKAHEFIDNTKAGVHDDSYPGGLPGAIKVLRGQSANQQTLDALNKYIDSDGQNVPTQTAPEAIMENIKKLPEMGENSVKVDQIYLREHPKLAAVARTVGSVTPFIIGGAASSFLGGGLPTAFATELLMNTGDAFATHYQGGLEQLAEREKKGEYFSPYEKEQMALNDGSRAAFGVGSWQTAANLILSTALEGLHVPGEELDYSAIKDNLASFFKQGAKNLTEDTTGQLFPSAIKHAGAEIAGQTGIQAGAQIASNMADRDSGVAPNKDLMEGVPDAMGQGAIFGGTGAGIRAASTAFKWHMNGSKISAFSDRVRSVVDQQFDDDDGGGPPHPVTGVPMTRATALDVALNEHVPPNFRDAVRSRIMLDETAKDQANVADTLEKIGSPATAQPMRDASATDANTSTSPVVSGGDKILARQERMKKALEEAEAKKAKEGGAEAKPPEGGAPPEAGAPPEGTPPTPGTPPEGGAPPEGGGAEETPTAPPVVPQGASNDELNAKIDELLGPGATLEQKRKLLNSKYFSQVYNEFQADKGEDGVDANLYRRSYPTQMAHEMGINTLAKPSAKWSKHTPELQAEMRNHFSGWLDQQIAEKNKPPETTPAVETPAAQAPPGAVEPYAGILAPNIIHQNVLRDAMATNNPWDLVNQLQSGKKLELNQDELEHYDDFLEKTGILADFDKPSGNYFLNAKNVKAPDLRKMELPLDESVPEEEKDYTPLKGNDPKLAEETAALPPHPNEEELLKKALDTWNTDKTKGYISTRTGGEGDPGEIISAATATYQNRLRTHPNEAVNRGLHLNRAIDDFNEKAGAAERVHNVKALDRPSTATGRLGHEEIGQAPTDEEETAKGEESKEPGTKKPTEEIDEPKPADRGRAVGMAEWEKHFKNFADTLTDPAEKRAYWHAIEVLTKGAVKAPEGIKSARGIKQDVHDRVNVKWAAWTRKNVGASGGEEAPAAGHQPEPTTGGATGDVSTPGQPEPDAAAHGGAVPEQQPAGAELRPQTEELSRRQSELSEEGKAPLGQPPGVLPGTAGAEGGAGSTAAGPGSERAEPAGGTKPLTKPTGEQAILIRSREDEAASRPGGKGATGGERGAGAGSEPASGLAKTPEEKDAQHVQRYGLTNEEFKQLLEINKKLDEDGSYVPTAAELDLAKRAHGLPKEQRDNLERMIYVNTGAKQVLRIMNDDLTSNMASAGVKPSELSTEDPIQKQYVERHAEYASTPPIPGKFKPEGRLTPERIAQYGEVGAPAVKVGDRVFVGDSHVEAWMTAGKPREEAGQPYTYGQLNSKGEFRSKKDIIKNSIEQKTKRTTPKEEAPKAKGSLTDRRWDLVKKWRANTKELANAQIELDLPEIEDKEGLEAYTKRAAASLDEAKLTKAEGLKLPGEGEEEAAAPTVAEKPEADSKWNAFDVAQAMLKNPEVAEDHGFYSVEEDYADKPGELAQEIQARETQDHEDPNEYYRELYNELGLDIPGETEHHEEPAAPVKPKADQPNVARPQTKAAAEFKAKPKPRTQPEEAEVEKRIGQGANLFAKRLWSNKPEMSAWGLIPHDYPTINDLVVRLGDMFRAAAQGKSFQDAMDTIQNIVPQKLDDPDLPTEPTVSPEQTAANIQQHSVQDLSKKLAAHFDENPDRGMAYGMGGLDRTGILSAVKKMFKDPAEQQRVLQGMAQKEGILDPPTPPGGTESSGVLNSLVPGMKNVHGFTGKVTDLIRRFRRSADPEMANFARSLNGNQDTVQAMPVRQLNHATPAVFYHDGELWITPSAVRHQGGEHAIAHEIQHAIAQEKVLHPNTPQEHDTAAHFESLRDELVRSLPPDLRDSLDSPLLTGIFDEFDGKDELDSRYLSRDQKNWLPVLYAAHSNENLLHSVFSNRHFRDHLDRIKRADGSTLLDGVQSWGRTLFGNQAFKFADESHPLVSERPGIPAQFDPGIFDLKDSYPLTEAEESVQRVTNKYQLGQGPSEALRQIGSLSQDAGHKELSKVLLKAVEGSPEIKVGLENRVGGYAGGYNFHGDEVTVNPHNDDHTIESTIMHEVGHAMIQGKLDAFEKGRVDLLTADEMHAVAESEDLRKIALNHRNVPDVIKQIADLPTYQEQEKALLDLFQRNPKMQKWYGLTNTREFLSEALSNGELQDHLKGIYYKNDGARPKTLLHKMFDVVKRFLGIGQDTVASRTFDNIATLMGGRRVMEADIQTGNFDGSRTMSMQENLLAKRYLDHRAELEGFRRGASTVPREQLNSWLREYRENRGMASGKDAYAPRTIAPPDTKAHIQPSTKLSGMTDGRDILAHLGEITGTKMNDPDALNSVVNRAYRDKAISLPQYLQTQATLDGLNYATLNKLHIGLGEKDDKYSQINQLERSLSQWKAQGLLPKPIYEKIVQYKKYEAQATATKVRNRREDLRKAIAQNYKGTALTPRVYQDIEAHLEGRPHPALPAAVINAADAMREMGDEYSENIVSAGMVSPKKAKVIIANVGKYLNRSYRIFDDPRLVQRPESLKHRGDAEAEVNAWLSDKDKKGEARRMATDAGETAARAFTPGTTAYNAAYKKAYDAEYTKVEANPAPSWMDQKINEFQQAAENKETRNLQYGHAFAVDSNLLKELSTMPEAFRNLIGEERDPGYRWAKTVMRQSAFYNAVSLSRDLHALGQKYGYFSDKPTRTNTRQVPAQFEHMGMIAGKYTTPEIASALTDYNSNLRGIEEGPVAGFMRALEGGARHFATIGNMQRTMANFHSLVFSHLNNGLINPFNGDAWNGMGKAFLGQFSRMRTPEIEAYIEKMNKLGLSDKEGNINDVMDFLKHGPHLDIGTATSDASLSNKTPQDLGEAVAHWQKKIGDKLGLKNISEKMTMAHTIGNFMSKASQWEQQKVWEKKFNDYDVMHKGAQRMTPEEIEQRAAETVRETNISYSRASPQIQKWRRNPVLGTFLTFAEQSMHSFAMSGVHALRNIKSDNPVRRANGIARLGGMITSIMIPAVLQEASKKAFGVSDSEDKNFRSMLPPWEKMNAIFYGPKDGTKRTYTNLTYSSPQSDIVRSINALLAPNPQGIVGQVLDSAHELFHPALNLGLIPGALVDISRNQTEYGTQVYNANDTWQNQLSDVGRHVALREFGGTVGRMSTRIIPSLTGEKTSPGGAVYNGWTGLLPEVSGLAVKEISFPERFRSQLYSSKNSIDQAQQLFTGPIQRSNNQLTDDQIRGLYQRSEGARKNAFDGLHQQILAARFGGMSTRDITTALKIRRYSNEQISDLMAGRYRPYKPGAAILKNARTNGNFVPRNLFGHGTSTYEEEE